MFAIQALSASYYPAYTLGPPALLFGSAVQSVLLAQSLAVATTISIFFSHDVFKLKPPHRIWTWMLVLPLLSPLTVALRDPRLLDLSYAAPVVVLCVLSAVIYQVALGVRLATNEDRGLVVLFLGGCWRSLARAGSSSWSGRAARTC